MFFSFFFQLGDLLSEKSNWNCSTNSIFPSESHLMIDIFFLVYFIFTLCLFLIGILVSIYICCRSVDKCLARNHLFHHQRNFQSVKNPIQNNISNISAPAANPMLTPDGQEHGPVRRLPKPLPAEPFEQVPLMDLSGNLGQTLTPQRVHKIEDPLSLPDAIVNANYYNEPSQPESDNSQFTQAQLHVPDSASTRPTQPPPPTPSLGRMAPFRTPVRYY